ncbi:MAG: AAA family ATPase [Muribaculaceae bacterium]|nr:AAA family ATPase [Muribaculaceae bacterium]
MANIVRYPVGMPVFEQIIEENRRYVDKTELIYRMTDTYKYVFLSRPRRFGKSLLVSTLRSYFEGRRELFSGLAIEQLEKNWTKHPVVHLSLASVKEKKLELIDYQIHGSLSDAERRLGIKTENKTHGGRLKQIIAESYRKYGQQVVVLIDEYDAPLLNNLTDDTLDEVRNMLRALYAPLKDSLDYIRFIFITGISKFSQLSIFSELNLLTNISMLPQYATLCGVTEEEMETTFSDGIDRLAEVYEISREQMIAQLRQYYDGYCFAENSAKVYNPFSLVSAFANEKLDFYWFSTGTPTLLLKLLAKYQPDITKLDGNMAKAAQFDAPTEKMTDVLPLFYQSGYLTIKAYDRMRDIYTLGYPNEEVRYGIMESLVPRYVTTAPDVNTQITADFIRYHLIENKPDEAMRLLQRFLKSIPYQEGTRHSEGHYTAMLYVVLMLVGIKTQTQVRTADGRIDMLMTLPERNYVLEIKLDGTAREALRQIESKDYELAVSNTLPTTKVGINFSTETATITEWMIKE